MTYPVNVSDLSVLVGSLELVISALVVTHHDKAVLAARLTEMARSIHALEARAPGSTPSTRALRYETVMSFAQLAQNAIDSEYEPSGK